jgi:hypothetical protein
MRALFVITLLAPAVALAEAETDRFNAGGYFRIMARPDLEGGASRLGYWNLYGRLLNEGPWGALELKLDIMDHVPGRAQPHAAVFAKIEGGSFKNTDTGHGNLGNYANTQLYVKAGNLLLEDVTWQLGTLYYYPGDLGLYDERLADLFWDTVGLAATYDAGALHVMLGVGDAGYGVRSTEYSTIVTGGGFAKVRLASQLEIGAGGQYRFEPSVSGNRNAPYATPGVRYEDYVRHEVAERWVEDNPGAEELFPKPQPRDSTSYEAVGYAGFGDFGPVRWTSLYVSYLRLHPDTSYVETLDGVDYTIYVQELTDERYQLNVGAETQLRLLPGLLDAVWAVRFGQHWNDDNTVQPGEDNRTFYSTVLRLQSYLTDTVHALLESSVAREKSELGNLYRAHFDSIFANTEGRPDTRGLGMGDLDTRDTWQLKAGFVLNPTGTGIFTRPSLRVLYGVQYSTQQAAYGNSFVENLDQYNDFAGEERHWHHVIAVEAEAWF